MLSREWGEVDGFGGNETHVETFPPHPHDIKSSS